MRFPFTPKLYLHTYNSFAKHNKLQQKPIKFTSSFYDSPQINARHTHRDCSTKQTQNICISFIQRRPFIQFFHTQLKVITDLFVIQKCVYNIYVYHLYNVGPTSSALAQLCINVIQMLCVCWEYRCKYIFTHKRQCLILFQM